MTRDELRTSTVENLIDALQYCGRDGYYAEYYDQIVDELTNRLNQLETLKKDESYYITRCVASNCPYLHKENRNCSKFGGFFTAVSNADCPMMQTLKTNIGLEEAKDLIIGFLCIARGSKSISLCSLEDRAAKFLRSFNK